MLVGLFKCMADTHCAFVPLLFMNSLRASYLSRWSFVEHRTWLYRFRLDHRRHQTRTEQLPLMHIALVLGDRTATRISLSR